MLERPCADCDKPTLCELADGTPLCFRPCWHLRQYQPGVHNDLAFASYAMGDGITYTSTPLRYTPRSGRLDAPEWRIA